MIDSELIKYLSDGEKARLQATERLFESEGYKILDEWALEQWEASKNAALAAQSWAENRLAIGRMSALSDVLQLKERTANEFEALAREAEQRQAEQIIEDELEYE